MIAVGLLLQTASAQVAPVGSWTTGLTHTVGAGTDRLLLFTVGYENLTDDVGVTAISYGGQSLTKITGDVAVSADNFLSRVELWYLDEGGIAAATGNSFSVTYGGATPSDEHFATATYENVDQTTPVGDSATASTGTGSPNPIEATVNVSDGTMAVAAVVSGSTGSFTWGNAWTEGVDQVGASSNSSAADNVATMAGTDTASATHTGPDRLVLAAAALATACNQGTDSDSDGIDDCVDTCPNDPDNDLDADGFCGDIDNCPAIANAGQEDVDGDGAGESLRHVSERRQR